MLSDFFIMTLQAQEVAVTVATFKRFKIFLLPGLLLYALILVLIQKQAGLRLKILYAKIRCQNIFS